MPNQGGRYVMRGGKRALVERTDGPQPDPQPKAKAPKADPKPAAEPARTQPDEVKETDNG